MTSKIKIDPKMTTTSKLDTIPIIKTPSLANTFGYTFLFVPFLYQYN